MSYLSRDRRWPLLWFQRYLFKIQVNSKGFLLLRNRPAGSQIVLFCFAMASNRVLKGLCLLSDSELAWHWARPQALMAAPASSPVADRRPGSLSARTSESGPGESKWTGRPMPVTSWPGRVARGAPRRLSDTSRQVTYSPQCRIKHTQTVHKHSLVSTLVVQWSARPCGLHEIVSSNPELYIILQIRFFRGKHGI